jgi:molybdopterin-binding protein
LILKSYADVVRGYAGRSVKFTRDELRQLEFQRKLGSRQNQTRQNPNSLMKLSARNIIPGKITGLKKGPVSSSVTLEIAPGLEIVSSITSESAAGLKVKKGQTAYAIIKASSVIIGAD